VAADLDVALNFYRDRFADFGDFTFYFVGNLDPDAMRPLVETWLGGLPSASRKESWRDIGMRPPTGVIRKTVQKGLEPKARTQFVFTGPFTDSRENRHAMRSLREALQIRLREILREDMGGVYGVGVGASSTIVPDTTFQVTIGFGTDPAKLDGLVEAVIAEILALQTAGPSDSVVQKVKEAQRRTQEMNMRRITGSTAVAAQRHGRSPTFSARAGVGPHPADICRAAQLKLHGNYVQVTVPEKPTP
jgi:zinc protease